MEQVRLANGIELHYVEQGHGTPVIFVHGSTSDYTYWHNELPAFAEAGFHAIAYSRRYNYPNRNPPRPGYSAVVDAEDLAAFIQALHLGRVDIVGHSYGALTALFLASRHPELVRKLVLCEPPAVSLLEHLPGDQHALGLTTFQDIQDRMVKPMQAAFRNGEDSAGTGIFVDYVLRDPHAWEKMSEEDRRESLKSVQEFRVILTTGEFFPTIEPREVRAITAPVLMLSGGKSYPFLALIDAELARLLPHNQRIILPNASHRMWYEDPVACRKNTITFLQAEDHQSGRAGR